MAVDVVQLANELQSDPIGMNYGSVNYNLSQLEKLLNDPERNVGGETAARAFDVSAMLDALDPTELDAQQTNAFAAAYTHILTELGAYQPIEDYKVKWRSMFQAQSTTVQSLDAQTSRLSRIEILFATGDVATRQNIVDALAIVFPSV